MFKIQKKPFGIIPILGILFLGFLSPERLLAQKMDSKVGKHDTIVCSGIVLNGDTLPSLWLNTVIVKERMMYRNEEERLKYYRLRQDVITVLPYAKYAGMRYKWLNAQLQNEPDKKKRKLLIKEVETDIKKNYSKRLKDLTITQGRILIKLVDRETGQTSYEILKELKNGFTAFLFQGIAGFFGDNLKDHYDPVTDKDIETIILSSGY